MMHLDEERLNRHLHGQLAPAAELFAREHLAECPDCRRRVADAVREEDEVSALLRRLDHPPPRVAAAAVVARARAHDVGWGRWAASILLALGLAGVAYAAPGSPLPRWVGAVVQWVGGRPEPSPITPAPAQAPDPVLAGIAVAPGRDLLIHFMSAQAEGEARVSLTDADQVVVRAPRGAATFTTEVDRLVIDNRGSLATFEIEIPRTASRVEIRLSAGRILLKEGSRVTTQRSTETRGSYVLPLTP